MAEPPPHDDPTRSDTPPAAAPATAPGRDAEFHVLGLKTKVVIVVLSLVMAITAIAWAGSAFVDFGEDAGLTDQDITRVIDMVDASRTDTNHDTFVLIESLRLQMQMKRVLNHQRLQGLSMGLCIALLALGFALFAIGADGAFAIAAKKGANASLTVQGTAPGLLCFLLAAAIATVAITKPTPLSLGESELPDLVRFDGANAGADQSANSETPAASTEDVELIDQLMSE